MKRRANGEATFRRRKNGTWEGRWSYIDPATGKPRRLSFYGPTRKAVSDKIDEARDRLRDGLAVKDTTMRLSEWLTTWTTVNLPASRLRESTQMSYESVVRTRIQGTDLANTPLKQIRPSKIDAWVLDMREKGVAPSTQLRAYNVLSRILKAAVRDGLLAKNPVAAVDRPPGGRPHRAVLLPHEVHAILTHALTTKHWLFPLLQLIAVTGIRRGEALGLRWDAVDLERGRLTISTSLAPTRKGTQIGDVKTTSSHRTLMLGPEVVEMLTQLKATQREQQLAAGVVGGEGVVFARPDGRPLSPDTVNRHFRTIAVACGVERAATERFGLHSMRHQGATAMLDAGLSPRVVADWLGHSSPRTTLEVYSHTSEITAGLAATALAPNVVVDATAAFEARRKEVS